MAQIEHGPVSKIEQACPNTLKWAYQAIAGIQFTAPNPQLLGAWSSGTHDGAIAQTIIAVHDDPSARCSMWGQYIELIAKPNSSKEGAVHCEYALINQRGSCGDINPYWPNNAGVFTGPRIGVGKPGSNGGEVSAYEVFVNVEGTEKSVGRLGQVWHSLSVKFINGIARVINFARGHAIQWWNQWAEETSRIYCTTNEKKWSVQVELGEGSIHFKDVNGTSQFTFNCHTGAFYMGSGAVGPNGTIRLYVAGKPYLLKATPE